MAKRCPPLPSRLVARLPLDWGGGAGGEGDPRGRGKPSWPLRLPLDGERGARVGDGCHPPGAHGGPHHAREGGSATRARSPTPGRRGAGRLGPLPGETSPSSWPESRPVVDCFLSCRPCCVRRRQPRPRHPPAADPSAPPPRPLPPTLSSAPAAGAATAGRPSTAAQPPHVLHAPTAAGGVPSVGGGGELERPAVGVGVTRGGATRPQQQGQEGQSGGSRRPPPRRRHGRRRRPSPRPFAAPAAAVVTARHGSSGRLCRRAERRPA